MRRRHRFHGLPYLLRGSPHDKPTRSPCVRHWALVLFILNFALFKEWLLRNAKWCGFRNKHTHTPLAYTSYIQLMDDWRTATPVFQTTVLRMLLVCGCLWASVRPKGRRNPNQAVGEPCQSFLQSRKSWAGLVVWGPHRCPERASN